MGSRTVKAGYYRHYKGNKYEVIGVAKHSETMEPLVVYRALYGVGQVWVRPTKMFSAFVEVDRKKVRRFSPIKSGKHGRRRSSFSLKRQK